jgi:hypothetical protein
MRSFRTLFLLGLLINFAAAAPASSAVAQTATPKDSPPPPAGLRKLAGDDAQRADVLGKAINAAVSADRWDEAIARAEELLSFKTRLLGVKHFETVNEDWRLKTLRRVAAMPKADQDAYQKAGAMKEQADNLVAQVKFAQAQVMYEKLLEISR